MRFQGEGEQCKDVGAQQRSGLGAAVVRGPDTGRGGAADSVAM